MSRKILIIEDEIHIVEILKFNLEKEGYEIKAAFDGEKGLKIALNDEFDLILLDIMLPKMDGFEVCRKIRISSEIPIIMLTAREEEVDKVLGLELGADDYITKPFAIKELMARIKANIRRQNFKKSGETTSVNKVEFNEIVIDKDSYEVTKNGVSLDLTLREYELIKFLSSHPEKVFSREELLGKVWGYEYYGDVRTVDVTIRRLREKVEDDDSKPKYIMTKRGVGYFFCYK